MANLRGHKERKRAQVRIRSLLQEHGRIGPVPRAGWKAYREWLGNQTLPADVQLCVETLMARLPAMFGLGFVAMALCYVFIDACERI